MVFNDVKITILIMYNLSFVIFIMKMSQAPQFFNSFIINRVQGINE